LRFRCFYAISATARSSLKLHDISRNTTQQDGNAEEPSWELMRDTLIKQVGSQVSALRSHRTA
jgi:hypothetical protein